MLYLVVRDALATQQLSQTDLTSLPGSCRLGAQAEMMELADMLHSKCGAFGRVGSSPTFGTCAVGQFGQPAWLITKKS